MKTPNEIQAMIDRLEENLFEHGWDASVDAASMALKWALRPASDAMVEGFMDRPDAARRAEWIARGGDPKHWPDGAQQP